MCRLTKIFRSLILILELLFDLRSRMKGYTRQMNLQGALDEKYIRIYVAHETTACNTWPMFLANISPTKQLLLGLF